MNRSRLTLVLLFMTLFPALASAQPVFFDDFDGDELLPHWNVPPDDHWEYEVSGGMLHVTDLLWPSDQHFGPNYALMGAEYEPQTDFRADVWMGWDAGDDPHELIFRVKGPQNQIMAEFGYSTWIAPEPVIVAVSGGSDYRIESAPPPGMYHFSIARTRSTFEFSINGDPFATFSDRFGGLATGLSLWFLGPYPGEVGDLHVDRVRIVPAPGVLALLVVSGHRLRRSRRRKWSARRTTPDWMHST